MYLPFHCPPFPSTTCQVESASSHHIRVRVSGIRTQIFAQDSAPSQGIHLLALHIPATPALFKYERNVFRLLR